MRRANRIWLISLCAMLFIAGTARLMRVKPIHAQQNEQDYDDGTFYISAYVDVDSNYNLYVDSYMEVEDDFEEDIDAIEVDGAADQDGNSIGDDFSDGDDFDPAEVSLESNSPVQTGHEYGMESDGYACYDDGEDDCDWEYVGSAYTSVYVPIPPPYIDHLTPPSVNEGDMGTLIISGSNLVEYPGDQLTINYSGTGMPFMLTGTPSSSTATFTYNFFMFDPGTYTISVTNNEGTSNSVNFTVNQPVNTCSQSAVPNSFTVQITGLGNQSGTFTVSHPTAAVNNAATTVAYGPFSTPSSVAAAMASAITRNYLYQGITAQSNGPNVIVQSRSLFGSVSALSPGGSSSVGVPSTISCVTLPKFPCVGLNPNYDVVIAYKNWPTESARAHIIRRHISNTASVGTTIYANPLNLTVDQMFAQVQRWNQVTWLLSPGTNGIYTYTWPPIQSGNRIHDVIGTDVAGNDLHSNKLVLTSDRCTVITSYPIAP